MRLRRSTSACSGMLMRKGRIASVRNAFSARARLKRPSDADAETPTAPAAAAVVRTLRRVGDDEWVDMAGFSFVRGWRGVWSAMTDASFRGEISELARAPFLAIPYLPVGTYAIVGS